MRRKKNNRIYIFLILFILIFLIAVSIFGMQKEKQLSELQITACNVADEMGTCNTRLNEVGIVLKEDCCKLLEKCC